MFKKLLLFLLVVFVIIQFFRPEKNIHAGEEAVKNHISKAIAVPDEVGKILKTSCYDCHSNQSVWPWYSHLAPISWLIQHDVDEGRHELNFSEWDTPQREAGEAAKTVQKGEMPLWIYSLIHPHARLSSSERASLIRGLDATMGQSGERRPASE